MKITKKFKKIFSYTGWSRKNALFCFWPRVFVFKPFLNFFPQDCSLIAGDVTISVSSIFYNKIAQGEISILSHFYMPLWAIFEIRPNKSEETLWISKILSNSYSAGPIKSKLTPHLPVSNKSIFCRHHITFWIKVAHSHTPGL